MDETKIKEVNQLVKSKSRTELIAMCKEKVLSATGTKHDMAVRLLGGWEQGKGEKLSLQPTIPKIIIRKIQGQWIHENSGIVFDDKTRNAIGSRDPQGKVIPLTRSMIEICKRYKFRFQLPDALDDNPEEKKTAVLSDEEEAELSEEEEEDDEAVSF